jgi:chromate reductase, NAD(P)H dehydrogenase (quinone)
MAKELTILGIAGSLRRASFNRSALTAAQQLAPPGTTIDVLELEGIPLYDQDDDQRPPAKVTELKTRIRRADAILLATPEYNYSVPGVLKNAIDGASRPHGDSAWAGKPVAVMGRVRRRPRHGTRSISPAADVRVSRHARGESTEVMIGNAGERFDAAGRLTDEKTKGLIRKLLSNLAAMAQSGKVQYKVQ